MMDITTASGWDYALTIQSETNRELIKITPQGKVVAPDIESANEAGRVFVDSVRHWLANVEKTATGWQPIETARKDGSPVLVWSDLLGGAAVIVRWEDDRYARKPVPRWTTRDIIYGRRAFIDNPPTHWMPIPAVAPTDERG